MTPRLCVLTCSWWGVGPGYLHSKSIIYRDIKLENVILDSDGYIRMIDFGLAKPGVTNQPHTLTRTVCGTPDYLAPEMLQKRPYGLAADWWSFGVFVYEMMYGSPPFEADTMNKTFTAIKKKSVSEVITKLADRKKRSGSSLSRAAEMFLRDILVRQVLRLPVTSAKDAQLV